MGILKTLGVKNIVRKGKKALKKRYVTKTGGLRTKSILADVAMLKKMVNAEKKSVETSLLTYDVGQVNGNVAGYGAIDLTPTITQGNGYSNRNGRSLKFSGMHFRMQIKQQSNAHDACTFYLYFVMPLNNTIPITAITQFFDADKITTIIDANSLRNPDYFKDYKILCKKVIRIRGDAYSGAPNINKEVQINLKLNHHLRYDKDTTTVTEGQVLLFILPTTGNCSPTTTSTLNVTHTAISHGYTVSHFARYYYFDN